MIPKYLSALWAAVPPTFVNHRRRSRLFVILAGTVVFSLVNAPPIRAQAAQTAEPASPSFEVASIRPVRPGEKPYFVWFSPGRFTTTSTVKRVIAFAYKAEDFRISGGPGWIDSEFYDVDARVPDSLVEGLQRLPFDERRERINLMIQSLLADRFKLKASHRTKELSVYTLRVAKNGAKLQEAKPSETYPDGGHPGFGLRRPAPDDYRPAHGVVPLCRGAMVQHAFWARRHHYRAGVPRESQMGGTPAPSPSDFACVLSLATRNLLLPLGYVLCSPFLFPIDSVWYTFARLR
jgi:hypothetical protein